MIVGFPGTPTRAIEVRDVGLGQWKARLLVEGEQGVSTEPGPLHSVIAEVRASLDGGGETILIVGRSKGAGRNLLGTLRVYLGQTYTVTGTREHQRLDGAMTTLLQWTSHCAQCGAPFTFFTPAASSRFQPNRRCQRHKRPGCRVRRRVR